LEAPLLYPLNRERDTGKAGEDAMTTTKVYGFKLHPALSERLGALATQLALTRSELVTRGVRALLGRYDRLLAERRAAAAKAGAA